MRNNSERGRPDRVKTLEREEQALELRRAGASYREIARILRVSVRTAHSVVQRGIGRHISAVADQGEHVLHLELDRLDRLLRAVWPQAIQGQPQAVDRALRIMERRSSFLGLDAPRKIAPTTVEGDGLDASGMIAMLAVPAKLSVEEWQSLVAPPPTVQ